MIMRCLKIFMVYPVLFFLSVSTVSAGEKNSPASKSGASELIFNGSGIRDKMFMNIYECSLFLPVKSSNYREIIAADKPMAIQIRILTKFISSKDFIESTRGGFKVATNGQMALISGRMVLLEPKISLMLKTFEGGINNGDVFKMIYKPGTGTAVFKNDRYTATVEGLDFKQVLFGVWLVEKPYHDCPGLRNGMLGLK